MKKYSISEILHYAADNELASKKKQFWAYGGGKEKFSCSAVHTAACKLHRTFTSDERIAILKRIEEGLEAMGCPVNSVNAFNDREMFSEENQQARYTWLKFAAMMAEEQGV